MEQNRGSGPDRRGRLRWKALTATSLVFAFICIFATQQLRIGTGCTTRRAKLLENADKAQLTPSSQSGEETTEHRCSPTPWLLPPTAKLPYTGLHNSLDNLLTAQAEVVDGIPTVSVVFFNYHQSAMLQNCLYSLIKWAGVCGYVVVVWDAPSLAVCRAMNLPCYDASGMATDAISSKKEARLHSKDYIQIVWIKPRVVAAILDLGVAVHASDADVAYTPADLTRSYLRFIRDAKAAAAFQRENKFPYVVNTGNYVILPTEEGVALMRRWLGRAEAAIEEGKHDQTALGELYHSTSAHPFLTCSSPKDCEEAHATVAERARVVPVVRLTGNPWWAVYGETCITKEPERMFPVHPCGGSYLYFHAVCVMGVEAKTKALKAAGLWFLDGDDKGGCTADKDDSKVVRCRPLDARQPGVEREFKECDRSRLAFKYYGRDGLGGSATNT